MLKETIAFIATLLIVFSYFPQLAKGYRTKRLEDVSMAFIVIIAIGVLLWIIYGILNNDMIFVVANIFILALQIALISMKLYYKK